MTIDDGYDIQREWVRLELAEGRVIKGRKIGLKWLANKLAPHDEHLEAGQVILVGSFIRPTYAQRGDTLQADYGHLGSISFRFV